MAATPAPHADTGGSLPPKSKCEGKKKVTFMLDATGNVSSKGSSLEGPLCIQVYYNPVQYFVTISSKETRVPGPDLSAVLGGGGQGGAPTPPLPPPPEAAKLPRPPPPLFVVFKRIRDDFKNQLPTLQSLPTQYAKTLDSQLKVIADIKQMLTRLIGIDPSSDQLSEAIIALFNGSVGDDLVSAVGDQKAYRPTDTPASAGKPPFLVTLQTLLNRLNDLPYDYVTGNPLPTGASCDTAGNVKWSDWYGMAECKVLYDSLKQEIQDAINEAKLYATGSGNIKALQAKAGIVNYWNGRFKELGLNAGTNGHPDLRPFTIAEDFQPCHAILNQTSNFEKRLVTIDQAPTLDGTPPTVASPDPFMTVTCTTRFSLTAGFGFSTIRQREFDIIKSAGGENNTSVNKFGTLSDSNVHPLPMALAHARLWESAGHLSAFHATVGIAGNIQGEHSGGSSAEFLLGGTLSLARTIYFSLGLHIGTKPELAGGFHEGDTVPTDITTIQGQIKRSYTPGFGFAVSFGKP